MSTDLIPLPVGKYPALDPRNETALMLAENLGGEPVSPFDLALKHPAGGATNWLLPGGHSAQQIIGVVIYTCRHFLRWVGTVGDGTPPVCTSSDGQTGVGDPGGKCLHCQYAKPGSHPDAARDQNARRRRGCQQRRLLVVLAEGQVMPYLISAPPASLQPLRQWLGGLTFLTPPLRYQDALTQLSLARRDKPQPHAVVEAKHLGALEDVGRELIEQYTEQWRPTIDAFLATAGDILGEENGEEG